MIGTYINAILVVISVLIGLLLKSRFPAKLQLLSRNLLAGFSFFIGIKLLIKSFDPGVVAGIKLLILAFLSIILGNLIGKFLKLQSISNRLGNYSGKQLMITPQRPTTETNSKTVDKKENSHNASPSKIITGISLLLCLNPIGIIGAAYEGLRGSPYLLIIKGIMDFFFSYSFARNLKLKIFIAILPMVIWQGVVTIAFKSITNSNFFTGELILYSYDALVGLFCFLFVLPILEIRKVEFADYLPSFFLIPLFAKLFL